MPSCAFTACEEMDRSTCPLPGGCVALRFAKDIEIAKRRKAKTYADAEGLKQNAIAFPGAPKKTRKKKR